MAPIRVNLELEEGNGQVINLIRAYQLIWRLVDPTQLGVHYDC